MKIKYLQDWRGHSVGQVQELPENVADNLARMGVVEYVDDKPKQENTAKRKPAKQMNTAKQNESAQRSGDQDKF